MSHVIPRLKQKTLETISTVVFFFVVFQLLALTRALILRGYGIPVSTFLKTTVAALIVGKVVLFSDLLPFMNRFPHKPLIYNIMWKTFIYMLIALVVRYVENVIPSILEYRSLSAANRHLLYNVVWPHFWVVQIWLLVCFFMYCTARELGRVLGYERVRAMFLGPGRSDVAQPSASEES